MSRLPLLGRVIQDVLAVGVKAKVPEAGLLHEALCLLQLTLATEERLDKLDTGTLAELGGVLVLTGLEHGGFASPEQGLKLVREALTRINESFDHLTFIHVTDPGANLLRALDFARQVDEQEPKVAGHVRDGSGRSMVIDGPVIDPFAQGVEVKNTTKQQDRILGRVPVLQGVSARDAVLLGIRCSGLDWRWGRLLLV